MASYDEVVFARGVIRDALVTLRWAATEEATDDEGEALVAPTLRPALADAVEEVHDEGFARAMAILSGDDPEWSFERVSEALDDVGWSGASRSFKEQVLTEAGRPEVMAAVEGGGPKPRRRVWRKFLKVLNVALGSLSAIPGVEPIKELKDFAEAGSSD